MTLLAAEDGLNERLGGNVELGPQFLLEESIPMRRIYVGGQEMVLLFNVRDYVLAEAGGVGSLRSFFDAVAAEVRDELFLTAGVADAHEPSLRLDGPIHHFFGLSYASYLVLPRAVLQSMPVSWQLKLIQILRELDESRGGYCQDRYAVNVRGPMGLFQKDPMAEYRHCGVLPRKPG